MNNLKKDIEKKLFALLNHNEKVKYDDNESMFPKFIKNQICKTYIKSVRNGTALKFSKNE